MLSENGSPNKSTCSTLHYSHCSLNHVQLPSSTPWRRFLCLPLTKSPRCSRFTRRRPKRREKPRNRCTIVPVGRGAHPAHPFYRSADLHWLERPRVGRCPPIIPYQRPMLGPFRRAELYLRRILRCLRPLTPSAATTSRRPQYYDHDQCTACRHNATRGACDR